MSVITKEEVAEYLHIKPLPTDINLIRSTNGAIAWVTDRRSLTPTDALWSKDSVCLGAIQFAGLLYMQRVNPQGFAGSDDLGDYSEDVGQMMIQIYRLVGSDPVIA